MQFDNQFQQNKSDKLISYAEFVQEWPKLARVASLADYMYPSFYIFLYYFLWLWLFIYNSLYNFIYLKEV